MWEGTPTRGAAGRDCRKAQPVSPFHEHRVRSKRASPSHNAAAVPLPPSHVSSPRFVLILRPPIPLTPLSRRWSNLAFPTVYPSTSFSSAQESSSPSRTTATSFSITVSVTTHTLLPARCTVALPIFQAMFSQLPTMTTPRRTGLEYAGEASSRSVCGRLGEIVIGNEKFEVDAIICFFGPCAIHLRTAGAFDINHDINPFKYLPQCISHRCSAIRNKTATPNSWARIGS